MTVQRVSKMQTSRYQKVLKTRFHKKINLDSIPFYNISLKKKFKRTCWTNKVATEHITYKEKRLKHTLKQ